MTRPISSNCRAVRVGETVVADQSAVLEMLLDGCAGMIMYDGSRKLAAASVIEKQPRRPTNEGFRERVNARGLALLRKLLQQGGGLESVEIFAFGADCLPTAPTPAELGRSELPVWGKVAMVHVPPGCGQVRRVEFDVSLGRIVLEEANEAKPEGSSGV